ncbi:MAG: hypothetical protein VCB77_11420 [Alphaproteobacteria bacterium]
MWTTRVYPDYTEAAKWYRLAAEQGNAEGQRRLGTLYAEGQGVPQDLAFEFAKHCRVVAHFLCLISGLGFPQKI